MTVLDSVLEGFDVDTFFESLADVFLFCPAGFLLGLIFWAVGWAVSWFISLLKTVI